MSSTIFTTPGYPTTNSSTSVSSSYLWTSPDDALTSTISWSTPLASLTTMTTGGSNNSSPTDFAFEPPKNTFDTTITANSTAPFKPEPIKTNSFTSNGSDTSPFTPSGGQVNNANSYPFPNSFPYNSSAASSFSSASGSGAGSSFSSVDALPAISRDFARPSTSETRRPATAGGALQSRSPFAGFMPGNATEEASGQRFHRIDSGQRPTSSDGKVRLTTTIEESGEGMFTNPFDTSSKDSSETEGGKQVPSQTPTSDGTVDPHYIPSNRRASEPQFNVQQSWGHQHSPLAPSHVTGINPALGLTSAPAHVAPSGFLQQQQQQMQSSQGQGQGQQLSSYARPTFHGRPQTSDGLPSYPHLAGNVSLPSAQSIARQIPGIGAVSGGGYYHPPTPSSARSFDQQDIKGYMPFRDDRSNSLNALPPPMVGGPPTGFPGDRAYSIDSGLARPGGPANIRSSYMPPGGKPGEMANELTFVQLGGPAPKKRPRRRYDEIERLYACGWNGCEKSYGTLNHLNAHVAMQKHGEKRLPSEFKDMRKAWRKKKREAAANNANAMYAANAAAWSQRASISSASGTESDWDRRDSMMSVGSEYPPSRSSMSYQGGYAHAPWSAGGESRPSTSSSSISSVDGRSYFAGPPPGSYGGTINPQTNFMSAAPAPGSGGSFSSASVSAIGRRPSAPNHLPIPMNASGMDGFRQQILSGNDDHPTPTAQNPFPQQRNGSANANGFPFATLTSPMANGQPMPIAGSNGGEGSYAGGSQFAFSR
ncbi:uncharacterized protein I303_106574 [Kwoniella dejecticola CBS 10117]|uniref:C2H2-type domain-containing protein n=1 Tax=Kwoniella dejecticola CBS 10117 TaxID=1296121 RepID=A0A1A5ZUB6_9TREE|nr:uncharacterized protein I303_08169 [Kwoniella dejecticola CBS 10117]OBR81399.1 hypothetical protein I303_08169 [Kwoniella dejecticola CBS 10117]